MTTEFGAPYASSAVEYTIKTKNNFLYTHRQSCCRIFAGIAEFH